MKFKIVALLHFLSVVITLFFYLSLILPATKIIVNDFGVGESKVFQMFWLLFINILPLTVAYLNFNSGRGVLRTKKLTIKSLPLLLIVYLPFIWLLYTFILIMSYQGPLRY